MPQITLRVVNSDGENVYSTTYNADYFASLKIFTFTSSRSGIYQFYIRVEDIDDPANVKVFHILN